MFGGELVDGDGFADDDVADEFDAEGGEVGDVVVDDFFGEPVLGDAVAEHAAEGVQRFEDGDGVAGLGEVAGHGQPGGAGADDGDFLVPPGRRGGGAGGGGVGVFPVGDESFEAADAGRVLVGGQHAA